MWSDVSSALAHLVRDLTAHSEGLGAQKQLGAAGLRVAAGLFAAWAEFRADADRARLLESVDPLKEELRALLEEAAGKSARNRRHRTFAKNLLKRWPALWSFASVPGVEPTNNHAERGLRGDLPQALLGQPVRGGRAHHRAAALGLGHLPPAAPLPLCLPQRRARRQDPRRPHPAAQLSAATGELNAYANRVICSEIL